MNKSLNILIFNAGSSSLKFGMYESTAKDLNEIILGSVEKIGSDGSELIIHRPNNLPLHKTLQAKTHLIAIHIILEHLESNLKEKPIDIIASRVVYGGHKFLESVEVGEEVLNEIRSLKTLAPLHNQIDVDIIETCRRIMPGIPVIAVFDSSFHSTLPEVASVYAIPKELSEKHHLRRFGFHGIAHKYVSEQILSCLKTVLKSSEDKIINCHLGNGSSICAINDGKSIDTSMGFTPMEGLVMGTRAGDIDSGLLLHLIKSLCISPDELNLLLNEKSGLLGISNLSGDVRDLENASLQGNKDAKLALECFAYRVSKYIGSYAVALGGVSAIGFSGGIGENSSSMRERICEPLRFLGVVLDSGANSRGLKTDSKNDIKTESITDSKTNLTCISAAQSKVSCWVVRAEEVFQIAREVCTFLKL